MGGFRCPFAAIALFAAAVGTANAQAFMCIANAGVPSRVRAEGRTELVGDLILYCTGTVPGAITANIQMFLTTNITSRITAQATSTTEALLTLGEPIPGAQVLGTNVFQGVKVEDNSLLWLGIPIVPSGTPPGNFTQLVRIVNVRANAAQLPVSPNIPTQISAFITITSTVSIPINNPVQVVAAVLRGQTVQLRNCQNNGDMGAGVKPPLPKDYSPAGLLKFAEGFDVAFKTRIAAAQDGAMLGVIYPGSDSGYVNSAKLGPTIGMASSGTRLIARFANIHKDVAVFVTTRQLATGTTPGTQATLVSVTDPTGTGGSLGSPIPPSGPSGVGACTGDPSIIAEVPIVNGSGAATWEIAAQSASAVETVAFGVEFSSRLKGKPASIALSFAPLSNDDKASATSPIPRFAEPVEAYVPLPRR